MSPVGIRCRTGDTSLFVRSRSSVNEQPVRRIAPPQCAVLSAALGQRGNTGLPPMLPANALPQITLNAPLVGLPVAIAALKRNTAHIMSLVDEGKIRWAFNFAAEQSGRCELRVLSACLAECQSGQRLNWPADEFAFVLKLIFPMSGQASTLRATTAATQLGLSISHFLNLCDSGCMKLAVGTRRCGGPDGSPLVEFTSVAAFLKERRIV